MTSETLSSLGKAAASGSLRSRGLLALWGAALLGLAAYAYRDLLRFDVNSELSQELQAWLMLPSQTSAALVVLLAGWLLFRRWPRLRALPVRSGPAWLSALLLAGGLGAYAWAIYTDAADLQVFSLILNTLALGNLFWGPAGLRVLALPAAFLVFAMPLPGPLLNAVVYRFQLWTADLTGVLLYLIGQPAFVSGDRILRDGDLFTIIEGCSGLRSVETLTMLSLLMADLFRRRWRHTLILLLAAAPIAFLLNGVRCVFLILNPLSETDLIHSAQGIAILLGGLMLLFGLDGLLGRLLRHRAPARPPRGEGGSPPLSPVRALAPLVALSLVAALPLVVPPWEWQPVPGTASVATLLPSPLPGWQEESIQNDYQKFLGRVGFEQTVQRRYRRGHDQVELFLGVTQHRNRQRSPLSAKTTVPGSGWIVEESGRTRLGFAGREVDSRLLRNGTRRVLVYHWREGLLGLGGETLRAMLALDRSPLRRTRHAFVARVTTDVGAPSPANREAAERRLEAFLQEIRGSLLPSGTVGKEFPQIPDL